MVLLFAAQVSTGLGNYLMPLQIGAADVAFPRLNAMSYWLYLFGTLVLLSSFFVADGPASAGWTAYPPLSDTHLQGTGMDLWIIGLALAGIAAIVGAVNLVTTIFRMRVPGMTMFRMPLFTWALLVNQLIILFAFPAITAALAMLFIDRNFGAAFFDPARGGSPVLYQHLFWFFGHPEVYIVILPMFGIISEIVPVFSRQPLFGYRAMVFAVFGIAALSFGVWAHHMFTTDAIYLPFFSLLTMLIAVPTGIKIFNWIGTMWGGSISFTTALLFAMFGGFYFWFPKMTGRLLSERLGKWHFWLLFIGFNVTFFVQFNLGLEGMPRRIADYPIRSWGTYNTISTVGSFIMAVGILVFLWNFFVSLRRGQPAGDDPWEGNSLEWVTTSPPPHHNFHEIPEIHSERPAFDRRHRTATEADAR